jgi:hypothetical protein
MKRLLVVVFVFFFAGCAPYKPTSDAGTPKDAGGEAGTKEAGACVPDFQACNATSSVCCISTSVCNINTGVCQTVCAGIGSVCGSNADCCSGICNGTCE